MLASFASFFDEVVMGNRLARVVIEPCLSGFFLVNAGGVTRERKQVCIVMSVLTSGPG